MEAAAAAAPWEAGFPWERSADAKAVLAEAATPPPRPRQERAGTKKHRSVTQHLRPMGRAKEECKQIADFAR